MATFSTIVTADWSAALAKRSVYVADVETRTVRRLPGEEWTFEALLDRSAALPPPVLLGIDAVLGLPRPYFDAARALVPTWAPARGFLDWLALTMATPEVFDPVSAAAEWTPVRPFFRVPPGKGSLKAYWAAAEGLLFRSGEKETGAKPMFAVSGIAGTVGSGTCSVFRSLAPLVGARDRPFGIWPFDGSLTDVASRYPITLAEMYPRLAYALGEASVIPAPLRGVAKTKREKREAYLDRLLAAAWRRDHCATIGDSEYALASEDDFDALVSGAALLRCVLDGHRLESPDVRDAAVEGSILAVHLLSLARDGSRRSRRPRIARPTTAGSGA